MADEERLVVALEARVRDFEKNINRAQTGMNRRLSQMEGRARQSAVRLQTTFGEAGNALNGAFAALGGAGILGGAGLAGVITTIKTAATSIAELRAEAQKAGVSFGQFQELKYAAEMNKVSVDALADGLKELQLRADEFILTGKGSSAEAFQRLGYGAEDLKKKLADPAALFEEIIDKLSRFDKAAQIRLADEIFGGTGGEQFVRFLQMGQGGIARMRDEARRLGVVLSDEVASKAVEINREFDKLSAQISTALKTGVIEGADALQRYKGEILAIAVALGALAAGATLGPLVGSIAAATSAAVTAARGVAGLNAIILALAAAQGAAALAARGLAAALALVGGPWGLAIAGMVAGITYLATRQDLAKVAAENHATALNELQAAVAAVRAGVPGATDALKRLADQHTQTAQAALADAQAELEHAKALKAKLDAGQIGAHRGQGRQTEADRGGVLEKGVTDAEARIAEAQKRLKEIQSAGDATATPPPLKYEAPGSLATPKSGKTGADVVKQSQERLRALEVERNAMGMTASAAESYKFMEEALAQARQQNITLTPDQLQQLGALAAKYGEVQEAIDKTKKAQERLAETKQLVGGFLTDMRQGLSNGGSAADAFANAMGRLADRILDMLQQQLLDQIFAGMKGAGGGNAGIGGLLAGLLGGASGKAVSVGTMPATTSGGTTAATGAMKGLDELFAARLQAFFGAAKAQGFSIGMGSGPNAGFRTAEAQARLFAGSDGSGRMVARPGGSYHEYGLAADLQYGSDGARQWAQQNASKYGLNYPMGYEPWHIEPAGVRRAGSAAAAAGDTGWRNQMTQFESSAAGFNKSVNDATTSVGQFGTGLQDAGNTATSALQNTASASQTASPSVAGLGTGAQQATAATGEFASGLGDGLSQIMNGISKLAGGLMQGGGGFLSSLLGGVGRATGGRIDGRGGGKLSGPGGPTSDSIPIWGSDGEYMVRAAAVQKYGVDLFEALNSGRIPRLAEGGPIGAPLLAAGGGGGSRAQQQAPQLHFHNAPQVQDTRESIDEQGRPRLDIFFREQTVKSMGSKKVQRAMRPRMTYT